MAAKRFSRRSVLGVLGLPALLAACGGNDVPVHYEPLGWDYLPRLKLKVAAVDIDDSWTPVSPRREKGFLAPTPPLNALRRMAEDRLVAVGTSGRAEFSIVNASIVQNRDNYVGTFVVRLAVLGADGSRRAYAEARVSRTRSIDDDSDAGTRRELNDMVRQMMTDMNVEFEYQIRHSLKAFLQFDDDKAPAPGAVEQQSLEGPTAEEPAAEAPAPTLAPTTAPTPTVLAPRTGAPATPAAVPFSSPAPTVLAP